MELLLKTYHDKPSRIGIRYTYNYQAVRAYEDLIRSHRGETFTIKLEPAGSKISLILQSEQNGKTIPYKDLEYRTELLKKLDSLPEKNPGLQFVHLYRDANVLLVAKPFRKQEFFAISSYEIIGSALHN